MPKYTVTLRNLDLPAALEVVQTLSDIALDGLDLEWTVTEEATP